MYKMLLKDLIFGNTDQRLESLNEIINNLGLELNPRAKEKAFLNQFVIDPASTRFHGNFEGGLIRHSANVAYILLDYVEKDVCHFENERSPIVVGLFHDLCKVGTYLKQADGTYTKKGEDLWSGHATKTIGMLSSGLFKGLTLTEEEALCIRYHMGAYEKDDWSGFGDAIAEYPTVLYTHTADMLSTHALGV